jgi:hypothetical protein
VEVVGRPEAAADQAVDKPELEAVADRPEVVADTWEAVADRPAVASDRQPAAEAER